MSAKKLINFKLNLIVNKNPSIARKALFNYFKK